jgi:ATPase subunit of ABC transporter with duplicated ATPase domains
MSGAMTNEEYHASNFNNANVEEAQRQRDEAQRRVDALERAIRDEVRQLEEWADHSGKYGWSTHQVDPMRRRAEELRRILIP